MKKLFLALLLVACFALPAEARDQIKIVGSSTVYPFSTVAAEVFGNSTDFATPVVEATGTGGGFKLFCSGIGVNYPDINNASRKIKQSEIDLCLQQGITVEEHSIGYDGIVIVNKKGTSVQLTKEQLYKAVSNKVYIDGKFIDNPYKLWSDIDSSLPSTEIVVYGPPPTSGTRDAFVELVLNEVCHVYGLSSKEATQNCSAVREDGGYVESGENDNLILQKLMGAPASFGIMGFSYLEQNMDKIQAISIDGVEPTFEAITDKSYKLSREIFFYVKVQHKDQIPGLTEFIEFFLSDKIIGPEGIATDKGLIPLSN